jgi:sulfatase maturation enzyme AslB (radical SAM superfamily)
MNWGLIYLVMEGLKRAKDKPLNYSQVTTVQQGLEESPSAFLQHLRDRVQKHITLDPVTGGRDSPQG